MSTEEDPDFSGLDDGRLEVLFQADLARERRTVLDAIPVTYRHEGNDTYRFTVVSSDNLLEITRRGNEAHIDNFGVDPTYVRNGLGTRLLLGAAALLTPDGVTRLVSDSVSADAFRTVRAMFGEGVLSVFDSDSPDTPLPMTLEQAARSSERIRAYNESHPGNELSLMGLSIDLTGMDFSSQPIPQEQ